MGSHDRKILIRYWSNSALDWCMIPSQLSEKNSTAAHRTGDTLYMFTTFASFRFSAIGKGHRQI